MSLEVPDPAVDDAAPADAAPGDAAPDDVAPPDAAPADAAPADAAPADAAPPDAPEETGDDVLGVAPIDRWGWRLLLVTLWLGLAGMGLWGVYLRFTTGHQLANYGSYVPWGLWVACYIYFIGLSAGAFILSSVVYVMKVKLLAPTGPLALFTAIVTLIMALLSIAFDLGHMNRAGEVGLHANLRSMMAWMIFLYSTYMGVIILENACAWVAAFEPYADDKGLKGKLARIFTALPERFATKLLHKLGLLGVPLAVAFHGGVGALFATVGARPYWHQPLFPIMFLVGALVSGSALLGAIYYLVWPYRGKQFQATMELFGTMTLALLLIDVVLEWAEFSVPLWQGISHEAGIFHSLMYGDYWWNFWIIHLLLGVLVPIVLLVAYRKSPLAIAISGALVAGTFISVRLNMVIPPLIQPLVEGLPDAFVSQRLSFVYFPSSFEWMISAGVLAVGSGVFAFGLRYLPLLPLPARPRK